MNSGSNLLREPNAVEHPGILHIVPTPIGNLQDVTLRSLEALKSSDYLLAEDSRRTGILLAHLNIKKSIRMLHRHNETAQTQKTIQDLLAGKTVSLVSDAGTPGINDPGELLIHTAIQHQIKTNVLPGCCACITALVGSGLSLKRFCFEGFMPAQHRARLEYLNQMSQETRTIVWYEAPHRIVETVSAICTVFGRERKVALAKELTKKWEQRYLGTAEALLEQLVSNQIPQKGEFVLMCEGKAVSNQLVKIISEEIALSLNVLMRCLSTRDAVNAISALFQVKKQALYSYLHKSFEINSD